MTDDNDRPKWLQWDNPNKEVLAQYGERMLTYDVVKEHIDKQVRKDAKLAQKLGQLQPFLAVFSQ